MRRHKEHFKSHPFYSLVPLYCHLKASASIKQALTTHLTTSAASRLNLKNITSSSPDIVSPIARGISPPFNLAANDDALFPKLWLELLLFVFVLRLSVVVFDMLREIEPKACLARSMMLVLLVFSWEAIM